MNEVKLVKDFACSKLSIAQLATKYEATIPEVIKGIKQFVKNFSNLEWSVKVDRMLKCEILRMFLSSVKKVDEFVEEIGMSESKFIDFIREVIEDREIIPSNSLADRIYRKAVERKRISYNFTPDRIIQYVAYRYISDKHITQALVGSFYGISGATVGHMLRRGIAEDIVDEDTADRIFAKIRTCYHNRTSAAILASYNAAFDKRAQVQHNKKIQH